MNESPPPVLPRVFQVRFGPEKISRHDEQWPNNLRLKGSGTVTVSADTVYVSDGRDESPDRERTFALQDIANVGFSSQDNLVALRTRDEKREALLWLASPEEARDLVACLPKATTPEFLERQRQHAQFDRNLKAIARTAPVTPTLIGLNVAVFIVLLAFGAGAFEVDSRVHLYFGANYGPLTWNGQEWRLLASAFIHFGVIHLGFNLYALYSGGRWTERLFGSARFAVIYLLSALAGSVVSGWWDASRLSAGASGAVFGVYAALLAYFARRPRDVPADVLKSVRRGAATLLLYSLAMGAMVSFIDNSAHVGGMLAGAISGFLLARPFTPEARAVARPWQVGAVAAGVCLLLGMLAWPLL